MSDKVILLVEDDLTIRKAVAFRLRKAGYHVLEAEDGQRALELVRESRPCLILLDLCLPVLDGYEVCRRVRANPEWKHISIILFTASSTGRDVRKAVQALGADDHLMKPFEPEVLLEKIGRLVNTPQK